MCLSGLLFAALGIACICNPGSTVASIAWLLGLLVLISGIFTLVFWIDAHYFMPSSGIILMASVLQILVGGMLLRRNEDFSIVLPYIFAFFALVMGISLAIHSLDFKKVGYTGWLGMFILGIAASVLGVFCFIYPLKAGNGAISLLLGLSFILTGLDYIIALFGINRFERKVEKTVKEMMEM